MTDESKPKANPEGSSSAESEEAPKAKVAAQETPPEPKGDEDRFQYWQSQTDKERAEKEKLVQERDQYKRKAMSFMEENERARFEAEDQLQKTQEELHKLREDQRMREQESLRNELIKDYPLVKRWKDSFNGTPEQMRAQMEQAQKELKSTYEEWKKGDTTPGVESSKKPVETSSQDNVTREEFSRLSDAEKEKVVRGMDDDIFKEALGIR